MRLCALPPPLTLTSAAGSKSERRRGRCKCTPPPPRPEKKGAVMPPTRCRSASAAGSSEGSLGKNPTSASRRTRSPASSSSVRWVAHIPNPPSITNSISQRHGHKAVVVGVLGEGCVSCGPTPADSSAARAGSGETLQRTAFAPGPPHGGACDFRPHAPAPT